MNQRYTNKLKIITLFSFICLLISCANGQTAAEKLFYQAYKCEKLDCQIKFLNKAIESNPKYAPAYYGRSFAYFVLDKHKEIMNDLNKAEELSPDFNEIIDTFNRAVILYPNNKYLLTIQGNLILYFDLDEKALRNFNKAIEIDPKFAPAYFLRGYYFENKRENEKALKDYSEAIKLNNNFAQAYHRHGDLLALVFKDFEKGIADLNKAIELNPDFIAAYNSRAAANKIRGNYEKAILDLTKSIELAPNNIQIYKFRASIYKELGKIDLAEKDEIKVKELENKNQNK